MLFGDFGLRRKQTVMRILLLYPPSVIPQPHIHPSMPTSPNLSTPEGVTRLLLENPWLKGWTGTGVYKPEGCGTVRSEFPSVSWGM